MDRMVLRMLNLLIIQAEDFEELAPCDTHGDRINQDGPRLNRQASGRFIDYFERELSLRLTNEPGTLKQLLVAQVGAVAGWAQGTQRLIWYNCRSLDKG
ncbi:MAG: hypothetical protein D3922_13525 [Candidatus Electrothrix sp. AR1]|nr:hypothetical protein [Candidatus Electrothrix sp. AR1]